MKKIYQLRKPVPNPELKAIDDAKRAKIEEICGKMNDFQWQRYKEMSGVKPKN